jgi:hypothetical protein
MTQKVHALLSLRGKVSLRLALRSGPLPPTLLRPKDALKTDGRSSAH